MQENEQVEEVVEEEQVEEIYVKKKETSKKGSGKLMYLVGGIAVIGCLPQIIMVLMILFFGAFFLLTEEEKKASGFGAFCTPDGEVNMDAWDDVFENSMGALSSYGDFILRTSEENGIDPVLVVAIMKLETGHGTSNAVVSYNNPGGIMDPNNNWETLKRFATMEEGLTYTIENLRRRIVDDGLNTIEKLGAVYAPIGADNDPMGLNQNWVPNVTDFANDLGGLTMNCEILQLGEMLIPTVGQYKINSHFGWRIHPIFGTPKLHAGIDLNCNTGDAIVSVAPGKVVYAENRKSGWSTGWGNYVKVEHGEYSTLYAHFSSSIVKANQEVKAGELIGYCGSTGDSTGAHLHLEVHVNGVPVDPFPYLED